MDFLSLYQSRRLRTTQTHTQPPCPFLLFLMTPYRLAATTKSSKFSPRSLGCVKRLQTPMEENDEDITDFELQCPKLSTDTLSKVVEYCTHYRTEEEMEEIDTPFTSEELSEIVKQKWYADYANNLNRTQMFGLIEAANFLDIPPLLNLMALAWACHIKAWCSHTRTLRVLLPKKSW